MTAAVSPVRFVAQLFLYVPLMVLIGYFSTLPVFVHLPQGQALIRLTFSVAGQRLQECRERSPEELAKLAPNMRAAMDCPRERAPVTVELEMDGKPLYHVVVPPKGLKNDLPSTVYRRLAVLEGSHHFVARLRDRAAGEFNYVQEKTLELRSGDSLVIDFNPAQGGFIFRR
ncbi:MAG: hypothetical protein HYU77_04250 [Betaproteobacteria bacterium]|nr:hypothetical protein [Betaproteobacteria bacterium]